MCRNFLETSSRNGWIERLGAMAHELSLEVFRNKWSIAVRTAQTFSEYFSLPEGH